jgi:hypothetical protein
MTPEQQRIAIAEACGWEPTPEGHFHPDNPTGQTPPNYLNDLNAMHEAEKVLTSEQVTSYVDSLESMNERWSTPAFATASQRAEAFLRTIGKWEEAK